MDELKRFDISGIPSFLSNGHEWSAVAWKQSIEEKVISWNSKLNHVDAHDDMGLIPITYPDEEAIRTKEMNCGNFLPATIFAGFFNAIEWITPPWEYSGEFSIPKEDEGIVYLMDGYIGNYSKVHKMYAPKEIHNKQVFNYRIAEPKDMSIGEVLGIDLDFFCTCRTGYYIEEPIGSFMVFKRGYKVDRDYMKINKPLPELDEVIDRIEGFGSLLENQPRPKLITIARSDNHDSFTPHKYVEPIETHLIQQLRHIYK